MNVDAIGALLVATLGGAAIGLERQWSATVALVTGIVPNTLLKLLVTVAIGRDPFRVMTALVLGVMALAMTVALLMR